MNTVSKWQLKITSSIKNMNGTCTSSLPVFLTEASTVSLSQGIRVFRSISSQEIPSCKLHHNSYIFL